MRPGIVLRAVHGAEPAIGSAGRSRKRRARSVVSPALDDYIFRFVLPFCISFGVGLCGQGVAEGRSEQSARRLLCDTVVFSLQCSRKDDILH